MREQISIGFTIEENEKILKYEACFIDKNKQYTTIEFKKMAIEPMKQNKYSSFIIV